MLGNAIPTAADEAKFWNLIESAWQPPDLGREYYEAVGADPSLAVEDAECESMCCLFAHLHAKRNDEEFPETGSGISRENLGNKAGWRD